MSPILIWGVAFLLYALFWLWYVGFKSKVTTAEVEQTMTLFDGGAEWTEQQLANLRKFLLEDDGKDFVMVNLLLLKSPVKESRKKLETYQKVFLGSLLRKAGHPVLIARAAAGIVENVASDHDDGWGAAAMVRYRSRRDFMEMLPPTVGSEHHGLKLAALERTFAFPASQWFIFGGPKLIAPLVIVLVAALLHLSI